MGQLETLVQVSTSLENKKLLRGKNSILLRLDW